MTRFTIALLASLVGIGCTTPIHTPGDQEGDRYITWPEVEAGAYLLSISEEVDTFEYGDLSSWGVPESVLVAETDTGIAQIVASGTEFSTRFGEELIQHNGGHALALEVTSGDRHGWATLTSQALVPDGSHLMFSQLSEVDGRGIELWFEVSVVDAGPVVPRIYSIPVVTGGHRPGLDQDDTLAAFPEVGHDGGHAGRPVLQAIDITEFYEAGQAISVRIVQRSVAEPFDFFTVIDDVCTLEIPASYQQDIPILDPSSLD